MSNNLEEAADTDPSTVDPIHGAISRRGLIGGGAAVGALAAFGKVVGSPLSADAAAPATFRPSTIGWGSSRGRARSG